MTDRESRIRAALRHVRVGRKQLDGQYRVIERLRAHALPSEEAECVLEWLIEIQRMFEDDYRKLLAGGRQGAAQAAPSPSGHDPSPSPPLPSRPIARIDLGREPVLPLME